MGNRNAQTPIEKRLDAYLRRRKHGQRFSLGMIFQDLYATTDELRDRVCKRLQYWKDKKLVVWDDAARLYHCEPKAKS